MYTIRVLFQINYPIFSSGILKLLLFCIIYVVVITAEALSSVVIL